MLVDLIGKTLVDDNMFIMKVSRLIDLKVNSIRFDTLTLR